MIVSYNLYLYCLVNVVIKATELRFEVKIYIALKTSALYCSALPRLICQVAPSLCLLDIVQKLRAHKSGQSKDKSTLFQVNKNVN